MIRVKITPAAAVAVRDFITELDGGIGGEVTALEASRLWGALQARCPHAVWSDDPEGGRSCDACMIEERAYGWQRKGFILGPAR